MNFKNCIQFSFLPGQLRLKIKNSKLGCESNFRLYNLDLLFLKKSWRFVFRVN